MTVSVVNPPLALAGAITVTAALMLPVVAATPNLPAVPVPAVELTAWWSPSSGNSDGLAGLLGLSDLFDGIPGLNSWIRDLPFGLGTALIGEGDQPYLDFIGSIPMIGPLLVDITNMITALPFIGSGIEDFLASLPIPDDGLLELLDPLGLFSTSSNDSGGLLDLLDPFGLLGGANTNGLLNLLDPFDLLPI